MANLGWFDPDLGGGQDGEFDPVTVPRGWFDKQFDDVDDPAFYADRPRGSQRPFPFLPSSPMRRA